MNTPAGTEGQVYLLTDAGVMVREAGSQLWRGVGAEAATVVSRSQLRSLRSGAGPEGAQPLRPQGAVPERRVEIYNHLTASWCAMPVGARRAQVGDAVCCRLPDGRFLIGGPASARYATYDPAAHEWASAAMTTGRRSGAGSMIVIRLSD